MEKEVASSALNGKDQKIKNEKVFRETCNWSSGKECSDFSHQHGDYQRTVTVEEAQEYQTK